jgi:hypothetical protein
MLPIALLAQPALPGGESPSEVVVGDPGKTVADFLYFISENSKIALNWKVKDSLPDFFAIERSADGKLFEVVAVLNNLQTKPVFEWIDDSPKKGRSFYRLKYSFNKGPELYSETLSVAMAGHIDFKFYPNPVDHILIIRSESPIDVQISDPNGKVRIPETRVKGLHTINVSSLEKGIYLIRFTNKLINVISQEKLIKN